ncbi:MAG: hypothetical protein AABX83_02075 [Nanoarchaeota archaeon]
MDEEIQAIRQLSNFIPHYNQDRSYRAYRKTKRSLRTKEDLGRKFLGLAKFCLVLSEFREARKYFRKAAKNGYGADAWFQYGNHFNMLRQLGAEVVQIHEATTFEEALVGYTKMQRYDPCWSHFSLGQFFELQDNINKAIEHYLKVRTFPERKRFYTLAGRRLEKLI